MLPGMFRLLLASVAAGFLALPAGAHDYAIGHLVIVHPWSRPAAAGRPVGVAYLSITNNGRGEDVLLRASTPLAAQVQLHQTTLSAGMARMRPLDELVIAPGKTLRIEPGGIHLMLIDLQAALIAGTTVPLTLEFRVAGKITVPLKIE
jgi:copper(I)-binding protein